MAVITLADPWTYRTPMVTIDYPAGTHEVSDQIAAAAPVQPDTQEADNDASETAPRAPRGPRAPQG